jgi:hypothetical protein
VKVDYVQVWRLAHAEGLSFKKSILPAEQLRPKVARRREQWQKSQSRPDPARLVFVDETWAKTNMAPLRGWAPVGQRLHAKVPYGHWKTMTFIAALRYDRIDAPFVFDQPINSASFTAWVEQQLCPTLGPGNCSLAEWPIIPQVAVVDDESVPLKGLLFGRELVAITRHQDGSLAVILS